MVFGIRVSYYGNGVTGHDPSPMCPCSSCWNAAPRVSAPMCPCGQCWESAPVVYYPVQQQQQQHQPRPASPRKTSSSSSSKKSHFSRLLRKSSKASIRSDMAPLAASETQSDSGSESSSIMSYKM